jgi:hypothetical protein
MNQYGAVATGHGEAWTAFLGHWYNLLDATAFAYAPTNQPLRMYAAVNFLNRRIYTFDKTYAAQTSWWVNYYYYTTMDVPIVKVRFFVGPIPMSATVGVHGTGGLAHYLTVEAGFGTANVQPYLNTSLYGEVAVLDVDIAGLIGVKAGLRCNVTLLADTVTLRAQGGIKYDSQRRPYYAWAYAGTNDIRTLDGSLYAFATLQL